MIALLYKCMIAWKTAASSLFLLNPSPIALPVGVGDHGVYKNIGA